MSPTLASARPRATSQFEVLLRAELVKAPSGQPGCQETDIPTAISQLGFEIVPLYKGQTASQRPVENGKGSRPSLRCLILLNRGRGFSDHIQHEVRLGQHRHVLLSVSKTVAPIRFATKRSNSGW